MAGPNNRPGRQHVAAPQTVAPQGNGKQPDKLMAHQAHEMLGLDQKTCWEARTFGLFQRHESVLNRVMAMVVPFMSSEDLQSYEYMTTEQQVNQLLQGAGEWRGPFWTTADNRRADYALRVIAGLVQYYALRGAGRKMLTAMIKSIDSNAATAIEARDIKGRYDDMTLQTKFGLDYANLSKMASVGLGNDPDLRVRFQNLCQQVEKMLRDKDVIEVLKENLAHITPDDLRVLTGSKGFRDPAWTDSERVAGNIAIRLATWFYTYHQFRNLTNQPIVYAVERYKEYEAGRVVIEEEADFDPFAAATATNDGAEFGFTDGISDTDADEPPTGEVEDEEPQGTSAAA